MGWKRIHNLAGLSCGGVFAAVNTQTGQRLISGTMNVAKRVWDQQTALRQHTHFSKALQRAYDANPAAIQFFLIQASMQSRVRVRELKRTYVHEAQVLGLSYNIKTGLSKHEPVSLTDPLEPLTNWLQIQCPPYGS